MLKKKNIRNLNIEELSLFFKKHGIAKFRSKQVYEWLWKKKACNFDEMTSLSISDRELLKNYFSINALTIHKSCFRIKLGVITKFKIIYVILN